MLQDAGLHTFFDARRQRDLLQETMAIPLHTLQQGIDNLALQPACIRGQILGRLGCNHVQDIEQRDAVGTDRQPVA